MNRDRMLRVLACIALAICCPAAARSGETAPADDIAAQILAMSSWKPLWDGKSFKGWHAIGKGQWTIEQGAIVGRHPANEAEFGHLVTDSSFRNFAVRLKYKAVKGNSGLYFRIEEKGFSGVTGFQAEIDPQRDAGGLYETNGRAWVVQPAEADVRTWYRPNEWNEMSVLAVGRTVIVHVNGHKTAEIHNDPSALEGRIALQNHGGQECEIHFKDVEILEWKDLVPGPGLAGWREPTGDWKMVGDTSLDPANEKALAVKEGSGVIYNGPQGRTVNLFTQPEHGDVAAHIEFMVPKGSNSGVYFQGRYEIQILDSFGVSEPKSGDCGGIYERWANDRGFEGRAPRVNASLPPGQWQSFDVVFRAPRFDADGKKVANAVFVKVMHNGKLIHENQEVTGPTRAAAFEDEKPLGPIMLQGDHGPVAYRNITILPLEKK